MQLIQKGDKILLVSPHPDDFEFGCGGTMHYYRNNITTRLVVLSTRLRTRSEKNNEEQQKRSAEMLGCSDIKFYDLHIRKFGSTENRDVLRQIMTEEVNSFKPDLIFVPSPKEIMQDHQAVAEETIRIIRSATILGYEVPKHSRFFNPNIFIQISEENLQAKINALKCFVEQTQKFYFDTEILRAMSIFRATNAGIKGLAEGFELYHHRETRL